MIKGQRRGCVRLKVRYFWLCPCLFIMDFLLFRAQWLASMMRTIALSLSRSTRRCFTSRVSFRGHDVAFLTCESSVSLSIPARDAEERDRWIRALEIAIHRRSGYRGRGTQVTRFLLRSILFFSTVCLHFRAPFQPQSRL